MNTKTRVTLILPTSINVLCAVNEGILRNRRRGLTGEVTLPSLRKRAKMIVEEAGVLPITEVVPEDKDYFTR